MDEEETTEDGGEFDVPDPPPPERQSMELPAVILGDRGDDESPPARVLPGKVPKQLVLYPAYGAVALATVLAIRFSLHSAEWHPLMVSLAWGLLFCWYWVYGVAYRYRRRLMKYFALTVSAVTAGSLTFISAARATSMAVPDGADLVVRDTYPTLFITAALTTLSFAAVMTHVLYLGRGYRQKSINDDNKDATNS